MISGLMYVGIGCIVLSIIIGVCTLLYERRENIKLNLDTDKEFLIQDAAARIRQNYSKELEEEKQNYNNELKNIKDDYERQHVFYEDKINQEIQHYEEMSSSLEQRIANVIAEKSKKESEALSSVSSYYENEKVKIEDEHK